MATDHEHINVRPARLLFEPGLLHGSADGRDDGGVGVASEVDYGLAGGRVSKRLWKCLVMSVSEL